jgi:hypothetical protein
VKTMEQVHAEWKKVSHEYDRYLQNKDTAGEEINPLTKEGYVRLMHMLEWILDFRVEP